MIRLLAAPALLAASAAQAGFAPPLDRPLTVTRTQTRDIGPVKLRFVTRRRVVFRAAGTGFAADVTLVSARSEGEPRRGFEAALAGLIDRPIRYWLDADGGLLSMEDMDAAWAAWNAGIPDAIARTASPDRRRAILGSVLTDLLASAPAPGSRPIRVPVAAVGGHGDPLAGFETVEPAGVDRRRARSIARGPVRLPVAAGGAEATAEVTRDRLFDIATGLVLDDRETAATRTGNAVITTVTHTAIAIPVS